MTGRDARVMAVAVGFGHRAHIVVHCVGMGEALDGVLAMAEGKHGRRRHEAEGREGSEHKGKPQAEPGRKRDQHG